MIGACGHILDTSDPDLCRDCAAKVVNIETPYWMIAGLDDPNEPEYDGPDYEGKHDMIKDWRSLIPPAPSCPRCGAAPIWLTHTGGAGLKGEEFICQPCGAIIYVKGYVDNKITTTTSVVDSGETAPIVPTYGDP